MSEVMLDRDAFLVSETDKRGIITFANEDFCKIAGYSLDELIGEPHNIVRDEYMPSKAFEDLWSTIKSNRIWRGYVRNATKSKDFYWVFATIYPMPNANDGNGGYMSCRRMANREEIESAMSLYDKLKKR